MEADWKFPLARTIRTAQLKTWFNSSREQYFVDKGKLKAKASDFITRYALMRHVVEQKLFETPAVARERLSLRLHAGSWIS